MLGQPGSDGSAEEGPGKAVSSLRLAHLIGDLPGPLVVLDTSGRVTMVNQPAEAFLGRSAGECVGAALAALTSSCQDRSAGPSVFQALNECLAGRPSRLSLTFDTPRGPAEARCTFVPTMDPQGVPDGVLVLLREPPSPEARAEEPSIETSIRILARASTDFIGDADLEEIIEAETVRLMGSLGLDFAIFRLTSEERPIMLCHGIDPPDARELMESPTADGAPLYREVSRGKSMIIEHVAGAAGLTAGNWIGAVACLPVRSSSKTYGCAFFGVRGETDLRVQYPLLQVFCNQVGISLRNTMLCRELRLRNNELRSLNETSRALSSTLELEQVLHTILHHAMALVSADKCYIFELEPVREKLRPVSAIDRLSGNGLLELDLGEGITGTVARTGKGRLVERTDREPLYKRPPGAPDAPTSMICVPLTFSDRLLGVMTLEKALGTSFTLKQYELMEMFSLQAALALHNASLFEKAKSSASNLQMYNVLLTHDVANFNAPIHGFLEMLLKDPQLDDRQRRYVHSALVQSGNISELISNVRELSQLRSKAGEIPLEPVDLVPAITQAKEDIFSNVVYEHINVTFSCPVPQAEVLADAFLKDLFYNLLSNACKYGGSRPVDIIVTEDRLGEREYWKVRIADGGKGIPDERKGDLFKRFDRLDTVQAANGHGLGLSVVGSLCERYGGKAWVEDRVPGDYSKGAVFNVLLPKLKRAAV